MEIWKSKNRANINDYILKNSNQIEFYHDVKYNFFEIISEKFKRKYSNWTKLTLPTFTKWVEGFIFLGQYYDFEHNTSFIDDIFNKLNQKYSFHLINNSVKKKSDVKINIVLSEIREIQIECFLIPYEDEIPKYLEDSNNVNPLINENNFSEFVSNLWSFSREVNLELSKSLKNILNFQEFDKMFSEAVNEFNSYNNISEIEEIRKICEKIIIFNYPTFYHQSKLYSAFVSPSYILNTIEKEEKTAGGSVVFFNPCIEKETYNRLKAEISYYSTINSNISTIDYLSIKVKHNAIKSAKAAIMSRNMSHNIGSHVMTYLKQKLNSVTDIVENEVLKDFLIKDNNYEPIFNGELSSLNAADFIKNKELPFLVGLGHFIKYLQERQDFIATISTDYIPYFNTVNFKDDIFDFLNPDYKFERHKFRIQQGKKPENLLLGNIALSEKICREDIIIKFKSFDGKTATKNSIQEEDLEKMRNLYVDLPGGILGRQAFFSILENLIRNCAKHNGNSTVELTILVNDVDIEYDHLKNDLWKVEITDNNGQSDNSLDILKDALEEDYIDESGNMKDTNKGIKEMRISAAWLRGIKDEEKLDLQKEPKIFDIKTVQIGNKKNFKYTFYLKKTRSICFLTKEHDDKKEIIKAIPDIKAFYNKDGHNILTVNEFKREKTKNYKIYILSSSLNNDDKISIRKYSGGRIIEEDDLVKDLDEKKIVFWLKHNIKHDSTLLETCLRFYIEKRYGKNLPKILILDDPEKVENVSLSMNILVEDSSADREFNSEELIYDKKQSRVCIPAETIIFKKHYPEKGDVKDPELEQAPNYVEGISGHNSTDRLVRMEKLNEYWYIKMVESSLAKIAVFDERLYDSTCPTITNVQMYNKEIENIYNLRNLKKGEQNKRIKEIKKEYKLSISYQKFAQKLNDKNKLKEIIPNKFAIKKDDSYKYFIKKDVHVFNIIEVEDEFIVIDNQYNPNANNVNCPRVKWDGNQILIENYQTFFGNLEFDFCTIHQGLLDKIYKLIPSKFPKNYTFNEIRSKKLDLKKKFTEQFRELLKNKNEKLIIHSGRSRPSKEDMPQEYPFVTYSSLEHSFYDCKYTLFEILNAALYES